MTIPLNTLVLDGISNSSIGSASLSTITGGGINVTGMNTMSDGISTDFSNKTSELQEDTENWPSSGGSLVSNAFDGPNIVSSLNCSSTNGSDISISPSFTGQTYYYYTVELYDGDTAIWSEPDSLSSPPSKADAVGRLRKFRRFRVVAGTGACQWSITMPSPVQITAPSGHVAYATNLVMTETIAGGAYPYYSFDRITELGNIGSMSIDSIAVN